MITSGGNRNPANIAFGGGHCRFMVEDFTAQACVRSCQQPTQQSPADLLQPGRDLLPEPFGRLVRGRTQFVPGRNRGVANELGFHWVDTAAMGAALHLSAPDPQHPYLFWHGHINRYLMEPAMSFLRYSFPD
jgi:hypothetical protein